MRAGRWIEADEANRREEEAAHVEMGSFPRMSLRRCAPRTPTCALRSSD
jgi:hypothetical protein